MLSELSQPESCPGIYLNLKMLHYSKSKRKWCIRISKIKEF